MLHNFQENTGLIILDVYIIFFITNHYNGDTIPIFPNSFHETFISFENPKQRIPNSGAPEEFRTHFKNSWWRLGQCSDCSKRRIVLILSEKHWKTLQTALRSLKDRLTAGKADCHCQRCGNVLSFKKFMLCLLCKMNEKSKFLLRGTISSAMSAWTQAGLPLALTLKEEVMPVPLRVEFWPDLGRGRDRHLYSSTCFVWICLATIQKKSWLLSRSSCCVVLIQHKRTHKPTLALPSALRTWLVIELWRRRMVCHSHDVHITCSIMITWSHLSRSDLSIQYVELMGISIRCGNYSNLKFRLSLHSWWTCQGPCLGILNLVHVLNVLDIAFCLSSSTISFCEKWFRWEEIQILCGFLPLFVSCPICLPPSSGAELPPGPCCKKALNYCTSS